MMQNGNTVTGQRRRGATPRSRQGGWGEIATLCARDGSGRCWEKALLACHQQLQAASASNAGGPDINAGEGVSKTIAAKRCE